MKKYDFVIAGGGAAGLSLAYRLAQPSFKHLSIAIIEPELKNSNDHTWCSWVSGQNIFDNCATTSFDKVKISDGKKYIKTLETKPYSYRMIPSSLFYKEIDTVLDGVTHIDRISAKIDLIHEDEDQVELTLDNGNRVVGNHLFKSYIDLDVIQKAKSHRLYVDQHFKGWFIKTAKPFFDVNECTMMDFSIDQYGETRFMYVLPTSTTQALVEVAIFSNSIITQEGYDAIITQYIEKDLAITEYTIEEEEFGIIPMTTYDFEQHNTTRITLFGTGGNGVKASTGYAFTRIQEQCDSIVSAIAGGKKDFRPKFPKRFKIYDATLLEVILYDKSVSGKGVFIDLFKKNKITSIFKFLDNKTNFWEELALMWTTDKVKFGKAFLRALFFS